MKMRKMVDRLSKSLMDIGYTAEAAELASFQDHIEVKPDEDFEVELDEEANFTENDLKLINDFTKVLDRTDSDRSNRLRKNIMNNLHRRRMR